MNIYFVKLHPCEGSYKPHLHLLLSFTEIYNAFQHRNYLFKHNFTVWVNSHLFSTAAGNSFQGGKKLYDTT